MLAKVPETKSSPSWTPEEIEELRRSFQTGGVARIDTEMFGGKFSEIIARLPEFNQSLTRKPKKGIPPRPGERVR
jgi:hypothetical protein